MQKAYPNVSWLSPKLLAKTSLIAGKGVFAIEPIKSGEVLVRWGGQLFSTQEILDGKSNPMTACQIAEDLYIASPASLDQDDEDFMNHSCDPNTWMDDEITISARRDIQPGEEVTADYALWVTYPGHITIQHCVCGSPLCRKTITGDDWKQKKYKTGITVTFLLTSQRE